MLKVFRNFLIAIDQAINCLIKLSDGWGKPDETLSARAYRLRYKHPWLIRSIDTIFFWDKDHCFESYLSELLRKHLPHSYREDIDALISQIS